MDGAAHDGAVWVRGEQCDGCLFTPARIVPGSRVAEVVQVTRDEGTHFICHKNATADEPTSICKGWFDRFAGRDPLIQHAVAMDLIAYTEVSDGTAAQR